MADQSNSLAVGVAGQGFVDGSDGPVAQILSAFTTRNPDAKRIMPPLTIQIRPASGNVGVKLPGPVAIIHTPQAGQGLGLQAVWCGDDLGGVGCPPERTGIDGGQAHADQAAGSGLSLYQSLVGQGQVNEAPEALALAFADVPGGTAVTDEDNVDHEPEHPRVYQSVSRATL
jgi:hypothetical protein